MTSPKVLLGSWSAALSVAVALAACAKDRNPPEEPPKVENTNEACRDGIDNDGDGLFDCADFDCQPGGEPIEACRGDGSAEAGDALCGDGIDNDLDGFTDCNDEDCNDFTAPSFASFCVEDTLELCFDSSDNDGNGYVDCVDNGCKNLGFCVENTTANCADGYDNDGDGAVDCDDPDCVELGGCG